MTADAARVTARLDEIEAAHAAAVVRFWERCGCLEGLGEIPSVSDCHQAGLCSMRRKEQARADDVRALLAAVRGVLDRHHRIGEGEPGREVDYCDYDGFVWPCAEYRDLAAALEEA